MSDEIAVEVLRPEQLASRHVFVLAAALRIAQERVESDPTAANIAAAQAAKKALDDAAAPQDAGPPERVYKNRDDVLQQLQREGYALKKSKLYADSKRGLLHVSTDKTVTETALRAYIAHPLARLGKNEPVTADDVLRVSSEKMRHEADLQREMARERKRKNDVADGLLMPREQVHLELAGRAAAFEAGLKHAISVGIPSIMEECAAIADKTERNLHASRRLHELVDQQMNEYAAIKSFMAVILENEAAEETE